MHLRNRASAAVHQAEALVASLPQHSRGTRPEQAHGPSRCAPQPQAQIVKVWHLFVQIVALVCVVRQMHKAVVGFLLFLYCALDRFDPLLITSIIIVR